MGKLLRIVFRVMLSMGVAALSWGGYTFALSFLNIPYTVAVVAGYLGCFLCRWV